MKLQKYKIIDNEGFGAFSWADEGATKREIIEFFYDLGKNQEGFETKKKDYTFNYIMDIWNVTIKKVKGGQKNDKKN